MLDIQFIRNNKDKTKQGVAGKGYDPLLVDQVLALDEKRKNLLEQVEVWRAKRNQAAKTKELELGASIKQKLQELEPELGKVQQEYLAALNAVPNLPSDKTPPGRSEKDNVELRKWGEPNKQFPSGFKPKDHLELGQSLGILDFETGAKVTGSQFYFLYGLGARLELALIQYAFDFLSPYGFVPVVTPDLAKAKYYLGTGYAPKGDEAQTYEIKDHDLGLIATAEVTLAGKHADEIIPAAFLPLKYIGYSHCFRQEAGAYGKYSRGMYRVHQFTKAEMFVYCLPEESDKYHALVLEM